MFPLPGSNSWKLNAHEPTEQSYSSNGILSTGPAILLGFPYSSQTFLSDKSLPISKSFGQFHGGEVVQILSEVPGQRGSREGQQQPLAWLTCPVRWKTPGGL